MLTKKHFIAISAILKVSAHIDDANFLREYISKELCSYFKQQNSHFDSNKFLASCDIEENQND